MVVPADLPFATDAEMAYAAARTRFLPGMGLVLDASYRRCHLPLVAPNHPDVIASAEGYAMGRRAVSHALVIRVDGGALHDAPAWRALEAELRAAPLGDKIAWDLLVKRQGLLHATLAGGLEVDSDGLPDQAVARALGACPAFAFQLRGLFSGNRNVGRLYLPLYPQCAGGEAVPLSAQRAIGRSAQPMFLCGILNLTDHLDAAEAARLDAIIDAFATTPFLEGFAASLAVMRSSDDLVLDGRVTAKIPLARSWPQARGKS